MARRKESEGSITTTTLLASQRESREEIIITTPLASHKESEGDITITTPPTSQKESERDIATSGKKASQEKSKEDITNTTPSASQRESEKGITIATSTVSQKESERRLSITTERGIINAITAASHKALGEEKTTPPRQYYETARQWAEYNNLLDTNYCGFNLNREIHVKPPKTVYEEIHPSFYFPPTIKLPQPFLVKIPGGIFYLKEDATSSGVITEDGYLIGDLSPFPFLVQTILTIILADIPS